MAQITIDIDDVNIADVRDTLCSRWNYSGPNSNPEKVSFLKARVAQFIKDEYKEQKAAEAVILSIDTVRLSALQNAEIVNIS